MRYLILQFVPNFCVTMKHWKLFRRLFILTQLGLATYFVLSAFESWDIAPIITSVDQLEIGSVRFPAISVCRPISWKWQGIVAAMNNYDNEGIIKEEFASNYYIANQLGNRFITCGTGRCPHAAFQETEEFIQAVNRSSNSYDLIDEINLNSVAGLTNIVKMIHFYIFRMEFLSSNSEFKGLKINLRGDVMREVFDSLLFQNDSLPSPIWKIPQRLCKGNEYLIVGYDLGPMLCDEWKVLNDSLILGETVESFCSSYEFKVENEVRYVRNFIIHIDIDF